MGEDSLEGTSWATRRKNSSIYCRDAGSYCGIQRKYVATRGWISRLSNVHRLCILILLGSRHMYGVQEACHWGKVIAKQILEA